MTLINNGSTGKSMPCARCQDSDTVLIVRAEHLCRNCFTRYVATKVLKRLETNKIRGGFKDPQKTLLLPVSFGVSSITLLHVLDQQLQNRAQQDRHAGYHLHVLFVDQSTVLEQVSVGASMDQLKQRYPAHTYTTILLEDCFDHGVQFEGMSSGEEDRLKRLLSSLPSATSKVDFIDIARRRLIHAFAKRHGCDSILFGDSTTRLAEKTLSEIAKGRGATLPWLTADGLTEGINCIYPMRDLLRKETKAYASMASPPLTPLISEISPELPTSSKDTTIDGLMSQYFESVEQNYPNIVSNVVRTSGKLAARSESEDCGLCSICGNAITTEIWGGEQQSSVTSPLPTDRNGFTADVALCYGCARTTLKP